MKVIQRFWCVQQVGTISLKNPPKAAEVATSIKIFNFEKTLACFCHQVFEIQFFFNSDIYVYNVCPSPQSTSSYQRKNKYLNQNIDDGNNNIFLVSPFLVPKTGS